MRPGEHAEAIAGPRFRIIGVALHMTQDAAHVVTATRDHRVERGAQRRVVPTDTHRDIEREPRRRASARSCDGPDVDRYGLALRVVAGQRTPDDRNVDASFGDGIDDRALGIGARVVAVHCEIRVHSGQCGVRRAPAPPADCCSRHRSPECRSSVASATAHRRSRCASDDRGGIRTHTRNGSSSWLAAAVHIAPGSR